MHPILAVRMTLTYDLNPCYMKDNGEKKEKEKQEKRLRGRRIGGRLGR